MPKSACYTQSQGHSERTGMITPFLNYKKQFFSSKAPDVLFKAIESLDLTEKVFTFNSNDLVSSIEQIDPLIIKFRNHRTIIQPTPWRYFSTTVWATVSEHDQASIIDIVVNTGVIYYILYGAIFFALIMSAFYHQFVSNFLGFVISTGIVAIIDFYAKKDILERVENLLMSF